MVTPSRIQKLVLLFCTAAAFGFQAAENEWVLLLQQFGESRVLEEVQARPDEARQALMILLQEFDSSVHSHRRSPENRLVQYPAEKLERGLQLSALYQEVTHDPVPHQRFVARQLRMQATEALNREEVQSAFDLIGKARDLGLATGDEEFLFGAYLTRAFGLMKTGRPELALGDCRSALLLAEKLNDPKKQALANYNLSAAYLHMNQPADSLVYSRQAAVLSRANGFLLWEANARLNVGSAELMAGNPATARSEFEEALQLSRQVHNPLAEGRAIFNLGLVYLNQNQWQDARRYLEESLDFIRRVDIRHAHEIEEFNPVEKAALEYLLVCYNQLRIEDESTIAPVRARLTELKQLQSSAMPKQ